MFGLPFFHVRESWTRQKIAIEKLLKNVPKMQMAVVRVLVLIQVGGKADGAADAAPSPARYRARAPKQAHAFSTEAIRQRKTSARRTGRAADPLALPCCSRRAETCFYAATLAFSFRSPGALS